MSIQVAFTFFQTVRQRSDLQAQIAALGPTITISQLVVLTNQMGFACSATDLQAAFRHDWHMRWLHCTRQAQAEAECPARR